MASLIRIFYDPGAVFAGVKERGSWITPLIAVAVLTSIFSMYLMHTIGMENVTRRFFDQHPSFASRIPPDKMEQAIEQSGSPARVAMNSAMGGVGAVIVTLIIGMVLMVMLAIMDRKPRFPQMVGVAAWSAFPITVVVCLMGILILLFSPDPSELDPQNLVATNAGAFLDKNTTGQFAFSLARSFDLLAIAQMLLLAFGTSRVAGLPFARAFALVFGLWIVWILLRAGIASATGF
jgi:hypothetical protein